MCNVKLWISGFSRWARKMLEYSVIICKMKPDQLLRAILPEVLIDNFDIERFEKSDNRFDIPPDIGRWRFSAWARFSTLNHNPALFFNITVRHQPFAEVGAVGYSFQNHPSVFDGL